MLRMLHYSDNHGSFPTLLNRFDFVLNSGDFFPNSHHIMQGNRVKEAEFQLRWLEHNINEFKQQLQGRDFLFTLGNHDFVHPQLMAQYFNSEGIRAIDLNDNYVLYGGIGFYGFPYIPPVNGMWNYEREVPEMQQEVRRLVDVLNQKKVDVLVCHAPIYGTLDVHNDQHLGNRILADALDYKVGLERLPKYAVWGHIHSCVGIAMRNGICCINSATSQHVVELET